MPAIKLALLAQYALAFLAQEAAAQSGSNILQFVDPLIGTANGGHVFAGATLPFGMAKAVPDSVNDGQGGYATKGGKIKGFSHMHDSGTGGVSHSRLLPKHST
jgi:putative alpha-1,2-mannosidase